MKMRYRLAALAWFGLGLLVLPRSAQAWGAEGHVIVAEIAEAHLSPEARREVAEFLAIEGADHLKQVANWADTVRDQQPETAAWHFVNIPVEERSYDQQRDCPEGHCAIEQLRGQVSILSRRDASDEDRLSALKWIVHLAADLHQPLHVTDHGDRGGNKVPVCIRDQARPPREPLADEQPKVECPVGERETTLHRLWDDDLLWSIDGNADRLAGALNGAIRPDDLKKWSTSRPVDWANEAHSFGRSIAYGKLPPSHGGALEIDTYYTATATPVVETMLAKAGVRLAGLLNAALR